MPNAAGPGSPPYPIARELAKDIVDGRAWRKAVARQIAPGAGGPQQIQKGVHRRSHVGARSPAGQGRRDQRRQPRHPAGRSDSRRPPAGKSGAAPPSTSLFAITVSSVAESPGHLPRWRKLLGQARRRPLARTWGRLLTVHLQNAYTAVLRCRQVQAIKEIADGSHQAYRTRDRRSGKDC